MWTEGVEVPDRECRHSTVGTGRTSRSSTGPGAARKDMGDAARYCRRHKVDKPTSAAEHRQSMEGRLGSREQVGRGCRRIDRHRFEVASSDWWELGMVVGSQTSWWPWWLSRWAAR
jgi:hypothetical protein